jgi:hypothetical protein
MGVLVVREGLHKVAAVAGQAGSHGLLQIRQRSHFFEYGPSPVSLGAEHERATVFADEISGVERFELSVPEYLETVAADGLQQEQ